jgi:hypothetical protein
MPDVKIDEKALDAAAREFCRQHDCDPDRPCIPGVNNTPFFERFKPETRKIIEAYERELWKNLTGEDV